MRFAELAEQISALQLLIERSGARANTGAPRAPEKPTASTLNFVLSTRAHGKVHRKDPYAEGAAHCGSARAKRGFATPTADKAGAPACFHCFASNSTASVPGADDISASSSESVADSSSSG